MNEWEPWQQRIIDEIKLSIPPVEVEVAYLVGGPADGMERGVRPGDTILQWGEMLPMSPVKLTDMDSVVPVSSHIRIHTYKPCPETGEWLWQGVR